MPYKNEMMLMGGDAPNDTSTQLCFNSPEDPFDARNVVTGQISHANDEDWIAINLTEGNSYTITVGGDTTGTADDPKLNDSILKLMDSKGVLNSMNDDKDGAKGMLGSELKFTPEVGSGTQVYFISVSGYTGNPGADNTGSYTVRVAKVVFLPSSEGAVIAGTPMVDKLSGTGASESIEGLGGNDTLYGGGGDDTLNGGADDDLLVGGAGADTLIGGAGEDTISYRYSPMGVTINLNAGTASGGNATGDTLGEMIENVIGSMHDDTITGTDNVIEGNKLWGLDGNDTLFGKDGPDKLYGGAGDDTLDGGDENDTLEGGYGADTLYGGLGADTASYARSMMGVTVRLHSAQAMGGDAEGDVWGDMVTVPYTVPAEDERDPPVELEETVPDIVHLTGSPMADLLAGDSRDNTIKGNGGDDKIYGGPGGGDDDLQGDMGNDVLFGGRGNDTLDGGMGNDILHGGPGEDDLMGGPGNDMIYADLDDGVIDGGEDINGMDIDTLSFARLVDEAVGVAATPFTLGTEAINIERVIGTGEDDFITGADVVGAPGDANYAPMPEEIEGGDGGDTLIGGAGSGDTVSYESSDRRVRVDLGDGSTDAATGSSNSGGHATGDTISGFENIRGSAHGDVLTAISSTVADAAGAAGETGSTLWGLGGDDTLVGGFGNDTIEGGAGADEMDGGTQAGRDDLTPNTQTNTLSYAGSDAGVTVNLASSTASGGHADGDEIETYELRLNAGTDDEEEVDVSTFVNVTGSMHGDSLTGDRFDNYLAGGAGDDALRGGAGADVLAGGPGADRLDGGEDEREKDNMVPGDADGNGTVDDGETIAASEDWATYRDANGGVTVNLNTGMGTAGDAKGDTLRNIEFIWGSMDTMNGDTFIASEGADYIHGDGGSDTISYEASKHGVTVQLAGNGATTFIAADDPDGTLGTGDDTPAMFIAATEEIVDNWRAGGGDGGTTVADRPAAVQAADDGGATNKSYAKDDVLASIENVTGSREADTITGDGVRNVIKGGAGNDTLNGGAENDKLYGEAGNDTLGARDGVTELGNDMLNGGAGNDTLNGGAGTDILVGGAGDDDLTGGADTDTFVFAPGNGDDVIMALDTAPTDAVGFITGQGRIDLSAFGIKAGDLAGLISTRAGNTVINLGDYGGGTITIQDIDDLDVFDTDTTGGDGDDGEILSPSVRVDLNGDGDVEDTVDGVAETDGIFIL